MLEQRIQQQFFDSADLKYAAAEVLSKPIADAVSALVGCITGGGKVLACGNGGSAADAQHFRRRVRRPLRDASGPAWRRSPSPSTPRSSPRSATTTATRSIFSKQVAALGSPGDVLLAHVHERQFRQRARRGRRGARPEMTVVALTGNTGGRMRELLTETDVHICVPHERTARIQEVHLLVLHCLCDAVDLQLLGEQENT